MGVMPFLATCHSCERCILSLLFIFRWLINFSLSDDGDIAGYKWCAFVLSVTEINYINFNTQP